MSKKRDVELFVLDIFIAIFKIKVYSSNFSSAQELLHDSLHWDAAIRQLEIIGEAIKNLLQTKQFHQSSPKYFRQIIDFRNIVAHGYFGIDEEEVWNVLQDKMDPLHNDLKRITINIYNLDEAFETTINYDLKNRDEKLKTYLKNLQKELNNAR